MSAAAVFCAVQADDRTWVHGLTIEQVESWDGPASVVADCPEHPHTPAWPGGVADLTWPDPD